MGSLFSKLRKKKQAKNQSTTQSVALSPVNQPNNPPISQPITQPVSSPISPTAVQTLPTNPPAVTQTAPPLNRDDPGQQTTHYSQPITQPINQAANQIIPSSASPSNAPSPNVSKPATPTNQSLNQTNENQPEPLISPKTDDDDLTIASADQSIDESIAQPIEVSSGDKSLSFWGLQKTVRPLRSINQSSKQSRLGVTIQATMRATLGGGDWKSSVALPPGENRDEWIAVNTVHFFNEACMIYGTCTAFCTPASCPRMVAGKAEYLWQDNDQYKKPTAMSAPEYIDCMLNWVDLQLNDEELFPTQEGVKFPRNFLSVNKQIYKRLFRLYAHLYCAHAVQIKSIGANAHLNTLFKHFIYFVQEFQLIDKPDLAPLDRLIEKIKAQDRSV